MPSNYYHRLVKAMDIPDELMDHLRWSSKNCTHQAFSFFQDSDGLWCIDQVYCIQCVPDGPEEEDGRS